MPEEPVPESSSSPSEISSAEPTPPQEPKNSKRLRYFLAGLLALALIGGAAWLLAQGAEPSGSGQNASTPPPATQVSPRLMYAVSQQQDGETAAANIKTSNLTGGDIKDLDASAPVPILRDDASPALLSSNRSSSQSGYVAYAATSGSWDSFRYTLELIRPDGTTSRILSFPPGQGIGYLVLSDDGMSLAYELTDNKTGTRSIWTVDTDGSDNKRILADSSYPREGNTDAGFLAPSHWTKDKNALILKPLAVGVGALTPAAFYRLSLADGTLKKTYDASREGWRLSALSPSPDGTKVAFTSFRNSSRSRENFRGKIEGYALRVVDLSSGKTTALREGQESLRINFIGWSPDGSSLVFKEEGSIYTVSASGGEPRPVKIPTPEGYAISEILWSGDRLVYELVVTVAGPANPQNLKSQIRSVKLDGTDDTQIASGEQVEILSTIPQ